MKPPPFRYHRAAGLEDAVRLLGELRGEDVKVLAGGQSLVPLMNMRLARPAHLVDITSVSSLSGIRREDGEWHIGALTTHADIEDSAVLAESMPMLPFVARQIGYRQIRNRGTVGGSLCHADPVSEWPVVMTALDARFHVAGPTGERTIPAAEFFTSTFVTALEPDELLTEVSFRAPGAGEGWGFSEFSRRVGDFAVIAAAVVVETAGGAVGSARIGLAGAGATPMRAAEAERLVAGAALGDGEAARRAGAAASRAADPSDDIHGSAGYRRQLIAVEVERAVRSALGRAGS